MQIAVRDEELSADTMLQVVAGGDAARLSPSQKLAYYNARCVAAGLDPRAQPFAFMKLNGKEVLYALKAASDQLAAKHGIKLRIVSQTTEDGIRVVTVQAAAKDGRETEEIGAVPVKGLAGDALCNALMKAVTKAKRRAILSLAGLGMLDETEIETIPRAFAPPPQSPAVVEGDVVPLPDDPPSTAPEVGGDMGKMGDWWDASGVDDAFAPLLDALREHDTKAAIKAIKALPENKQAEGKRIYSEAQRRG